MTYSLIIDLDAVKQEVKWELHWKGLRYGNHIIAKDTDATDDELFEIAFENVVDSFREIRRKQRGVVSLGGPMGDSDFYPTREKVMRNNPAA